MQYLTQLRAPGASSAQVIDIANAIAGLSSALADTQSAIYSIGLQVDTINGSTSATYTKLVGLVDGPENAIEYQYGADFGSTDEAVMTNANAQQYIEVIGLYIRGGALSTDVVDISLRTGNLADGTAAAILVNDTKFTVGNGAVLWSPRDPKRVICRSANGENIVFRKHTTGKPCTIAMWYRTVYF